MKTARLTLLTTPDFKAFLGVEAALGGVSVAELVRRRCEQRPTADEEALAALTHELRTAVQEAQASMRAGVAETASVLTELRSCRDQVNPSNLVGPAKARQDIPKTAPVKVRKSKAHA